MFFREEKDYDATCVRCGHGIYFSIGPGLMDCPSCGEDYKYTDEQLEQKHKEEKIAEEESEQKMRNRQRKIDLLYKLKNKASVKEAKLLDEIINDISYFGLYDSNSGLFWFRRNY